MTTPRQFYEILISNMPAGIERAMLRVISFHVGKDAAISKPQLLTELKRLGFPTNERSARLCIVDLRNNGHLICSSSGEGGYFLAATMEEYSEFVGREYESRIRELAQTKAAMDAGAKSLFHGAPEKAKQASLF